MEGTSRDTLRELILNTWNPAGQLRNYFKPIGTEQIGAALDILHPMLRYYHPGLVKQSMQDEIRSPRSAGRTPDIYNVKEWCQDAAKYAPKAPAPSFNVRHDPSHVYPFDLLPSDTSGFAQFVGQSTVVDTFQESWFDRVIELVYANDFVVRKGGGMEFDARHLVPLYERQRAMCAVRREHYENAQRDPEFQAAMRKMMTGEGVVPVVTRA
jgi:hypothetical protein